MSFNPAKALACYVALPLALAVSDEHKAMKAFYFAVWCLFLPLFFMLVLLQGLWERLNGDLPHSRTSGAGNSPPKKVEQK